MGRRYRSHWIRYLEWSPVHDSQNLGEWTVCPKYIHMYTGCIVHLFLQKLGCGSPLCNRCHIHPAGLLHVFWHCLKQVRYWTGVPDRINLILSVSVDATTLTCILGHVEDLATRMEGKMWLLEHYIWPERLGLDSHPPTVWELENKIISLLSWKRAGYPNSKNCVPIGLIPLAWPHCILLGIGRLSLPCRAGWEWRLNTEHALDALHEPSEGAVM